MAFDDFHPFFLTPQNLGPPHWPRTSSHDAHRRLDQHPHYPASGYSFAGHPLSVVSTQYGTSAYNSHSPEFFLPQNNWHPSPERGWFSHNVPSPTEAFTPGAQCARPSYAEKLIQPVQSDHHRKSEVDVAQKHVQTSQRRVHRHPLFQIRYKPVRCQKKFIVSDTIEFVVNSEEGIRLSDAAEGNWGGFEGRDDRSLVGEDRPQIIIRIQLVGCLPFQSKINTLDFTSKRRPIPRTRLAAEVAKVMKKFIAREKLNGHGTGHPLCGWGDVPLENVFLTRLVRVSVASWQPEFVVERPGTSCGRFSSSSLKALA